MSKKNSLITHKHLWKFLTHQPYFVWHNYEKESKFDDEDEDYAENFWELDFDFEEDLEYGSIMKNGFDEVVKILLATIMEEGAKKLKTIEVITEKKPEIAFQKTMDAINDENIDWILNPVFIYNDAIAKPFIYKKNEKEMGSLVFSSKTKLKNYIQAYFEYNILKKCGVEIDEYFFYYFDSNDNRKYKKAKEVFFKETYYCWTSKTGPSKDTKQTIEANCQDETIVTKITQGIIKKDVYINTDFDYYLNKINQARDIDYYREISDDDLTPWGENKHFNDLFPFQDLGLPKLSGVLINKRTLLALLNSEMYLDNVMKEKNSLQLFWKKKIVIDKKDVINNFILPISNSRVVWYDFEGFSLPYSTMPYVKPYQQLAFQVSVIKTEKDYMSQSNNIVIDPKTISAQDFEKVIDAIYDQEAKHYVVYNKSYEHSRLKEMDELLNYKYSDKINHIIDNTIDLLDVFKTSNSKDNVPSVFIPELLGFSSIKKIENYITQNNLKLPVMITPYKELEVQNGLMAMEKAIQRYLGTIGDLAWEQEVKKLELYCENDVRAMIMVFEFLKYIVEKEE